MSVIEVDVMVADARWSAAGGVEALADRALRAALAAGGVALRDGAEVSILLTDDAAIAVLNGQWRGKASATNVLSFPACEPAALAKSPMIGDIALAYETCAREAADQGKTLADHLTHLVVHGALHLVGFDHETEADAERMEALEVRILQGLGVADPYGAEALP